MGVCGRIGEKLPESYQMQDQKQGNVGHIGKG